MQRKICQDKTARYPKRPNLNRSELLLHTDVYKQVKAESVAEAKQ